MYILHHALTPHKVHPLPLNTLITLFLLRRFSYSHTFSYSWRTVSAIMNWLASLHRMVYSFLLKQMFVWYRFMSHFYKYSLHQTKGGRKLIIYLNTVLSLWTANRKIVIMKSKQNSKKSFHRPIVIKYLTNKYRSLEKPQQVFRLRYLTWSPK